MTPNELLSVFLSDQSNRMEKCKAGERLLVETAPVTEQTLNKIVQQLSSSRFNSLAAKVANRYIGSIEGSFHSGLGKTLIRLAATTRDDALFSRVTSRIDPSLLAPGGDLSGVYARSLLLLRGYDEGMSYFLSCDPSSSRYPFIVPEFLYGLYESNRFKECVDLYALIKSRNEEGSLLQHSRIYAAVIGSFLAQNDKAAADTLLASMRRSHVLPLRETFYDYLEYCDRCDDYKREFAKMVSRTSNLTAVQSSFLLSLAKCRQYDQYLPLVREHDTFRYYRTLQENEATQTMQLSVRLTPQAYQRLEVYKVLREVKNKPKDVWYDGCLVIQLDVDSSGVRRLLMEDLQPSIEFKLLDFDAICVELSSVYSWNAIHERLNKQLGM